MAIGNWQRRQNFGNIGCLHALPNKSTAFLCCNFQTLDSSTNSAFRNAEPFGILHFLQTTGGNLLLSLDYLLLLRLNSEDSLATAHINSSWFQFVSCPKTDALLAKKRQLAIDKGGRILETLAFVAMTLMTRISAYVVWNQDSGNRCNLSPSGFSGCSGSWWLHWFRLSPNLNPLNPISGLDRR